MYKYLIFLKKYIEACTMYYRLIIRKILPYQKQFHGKYNKMQLKTFKEKGLIFQTHLCVLDRETRLPDDLQLSVWGDIFAGIIKLPTIV